MNRVGLFDLDREALGATLDGHPRYRVDQVWEALYRQGRLPEEMTNLPRSLRAELADRHPLSLAVVRHAASDDGETDKFLFELHDGSTIETVLMRYPDRATVCVSSQAGCAMACGFCATGQAGFDRHLGVGEIVEQVVRARRAAAPRRISNVVFMGMGEPLANYDNTWEAIRRLHTDMGISARHLTVSTVGLVPAIDRVAAEDLPVTLAVSLHAARDELRDQLVPINRRYPLAALADACRRYVEAKGRRLSIEWAMIAGVNDTDRDASELAELATDLRAHVNLIPLNPTDGFATRGTDRRGIRRFADLLTAHEVNVTVRSNRGNEIDAACGQLRAREIRLAPSRGRSLTD